MISSYSTNHHWPRPQWNNNISYDSCSSSTLDGTSDTSSQESGDLVRVHSILRLSEDSWKSLESGRAWRKEQRGHREKLPGHGIFLKHALEQKLGQCVVVKRMVNGDFALQLGEVRITVVPGDIDSTKAEVVGDRNALTDARYEAVTQSIQTMKDSIDRHELIQYMSTESLHHEQDRDILESDVERLCKKLEKNSSDIADLQKEIARVKLEREANKFENFAISAMYEGALYIADAFIRTACYDSVKLENGEYPTGNIPEFCVKNKKNKNVPNHPEQTIRSPKVVVLNVYDRQNVAKDQRFNVTDQLRESMDQIAEIFGGPQNLIAAVTFLQDLKKSRSKHVHIDSKRNFMKILKGYVHDGSTEDYDFFTKIKEYRNAFEQVISIENAGGDPTKEKIDNLANFDQMMEISGKLYKYLLFEDPRSQDNKEN